MITNTADVRLDSMKRSGPLFIAAVLVLAACSSASVTSPPPATKASAPPPPTIQPTPGEATPLRLSAIQRLNARVGFIAGWTGTGLGLAKTRDGGSTWQRLPIPVSFLTALRFIDENVGWTVGFADPNDGAVLRTEDGGQTWQTMLRINFQTNAAGADAVRQIQAVDGQRAWALTLDPSPCRYECTYDLQRTTDGGKTWAVLLRGEIAAIRFASASRGWIALDNTPSSGTVEARETSDGGTTWTTVLQTATGDAMALDAATTDTAWLLTRDGAYCTSSNCSRYALFRTSDGGLTWLALRNPKDSTVGCIPGGHLVGPLFASPGRGWLGLSLGAGGVNVGPGGILKSEDGGWTWRCATNPPNTSLVSAADPLHVWAASEDRINQLTALYATEDAGATWHRLELSSLQ